MTRSTLGTFTLGILLAACTPPPSGGTTPTAQPSGEAPPPAPPASDAPSGIDKSQFDTSVRPQDDFYRHVNGTWLKNNPVPSDKSNYGSFTKLADDTQEQLKKIIDDSAAGENAAGSDAQKVGDFYKAFMDEERADELGLTPLQAEIDRLDDIRSPRQLPEILARLARMGVNVVPVYVDTDAKDATQYSLYVLQGGTGLPDRDYYLEDDEKFVKIRTAYQAHIAKMLELAKIRGAATMAPKILALETALAKVQWTKVDSRKDDKTYNKFPMPGGEDRALAKLTPRFDWKAFLDGIGASKSPGIIVAQPSFYTGFDQLLSRTPLPVIKAWLKWHTISSFASYLSKDFVDEDFAFFGKELNGIAEQEPRWKRGVKATEGALGEVLGKIYVERHFPPEAKTRMDELVANLVEAYRVSIQNLSWMSDATKKKALVKLDKFNPKIGYPKKWKDYSKLEIKPDDLLGNVARSRRVEHDREMAKLGGPIDRDEWFMTPQTINAYYNPGMNEIVFPAAILQPPFFDMKADDAANYGGIGAVIGHEIGHGFDDQGSKRDGDGNLISWWTEEDRARFEALTKKLIAQYDEYEALPGKNVNGAFTVGENIGDLGGLGIAHKAYRMSLGGKEAPVIDGLTGDQRLFMGWAQVWRRNYKDENLLNRLKADPHSPSEFRCNGVVRNIDAWYEAFDVKESDALYLPPDQRLKIW